MFSSTQFSCPNSSFIKSYSHLVRKHLFPRSAQTFILTGCSVRNLQHRSRFIASLGIATFNILLYPSPYCWGSYRLWLQMLRRIFLMIMIHRNGWATYLHGSVVRFILLRDFHKFLRIIDERVLKELILHCSLL